LVSTASATAGPVFGRLNQRRSHAVEALAGLGIPFPDAEAPVTFGFVGGFDA
jgi:hypothetical protein